MRKAGGADLFFRSAALPLTLADSRLTIHQGRVGSAESLVLGLCGSSPNSRADSLPRCGDSLPVVKMERSDATKRCRRDMTPHYTPPSTRHTEEPLRTVIGIWITEEPQSPNTRDSALLAEISPQGNAGRR